MAVLDTLHVFDEFVWMFRVEDERERFKGESGVKKKGAIWPSHHVWEKSLDSALKRGKHAQDPPGLQISQPDGVSANGLTTFSRGRGTNKSECAFSESEKTSSALFSCPCTSRPTNALCAWDIHFQYLKLCWQAIISSLHTNLQKKMPWSCSVALKPNTTRGRGKDCQRAMRGTSPSATTTGGIPRLRPCLKPRFAFIDDNVPQTRHFLDGHPSL